MLPDVLLHNLESGFSESMAKSPGQNFSYADPIEGTLLGT